METDSMLSYLDLEVNISDRRFTMAVFDKRDSFSFHIVNFPHMDSKISYSGKFSLVHNFAQLHVSPSEEIFVVLISCFSTSRPHPRQSIACVISHVFSAHLRFRGTQPIREKHDHAKISRLYIRYLANQPMGFISLS
jgi:hypothetical protein